MFFADYSRSGIA